MFEDRRTSKHYLGMRGSDVVTLLYHIHKASIDPNIGHQDFENSLGSLLRDLNQKVFKIRLSKVESALYAANLMDEQQQFWHPDNLSFDEYVRDILVKGRKPYVYDRFYNYFKAKA